MKVTEQLHQVIFDRNGSHKVFEGTYHACVEFMLNEHSGRIARVKTDIDKLESPGKIKQALMHLAPAHNYAKELRK